MSNINKKVTIGHVHLKVSNIDLSLDFYCGVLGFELKQRLGNQAAFIAAGDYHHHIGLNTWESSGGMPPPVGTTGLYHLTLYCSKIFGRKSKLPCRMKHLLIKKPRS